MSKLTSLILLALLSISAFATTGRADAIHEAMKVCTETAVNIDDRRDAFVERGWRVVESNEQARSALADAIVLSNAPCCSERSAWDDRRSWALEQAPEYPAEVLLQSESAFVWLRRMPNVTQTACFLATPTVSQYGADLMSEAQALETMEVLSSTYEGRISRASSEPGNGLVTIVHLTALGGRGEIPDFGRRLDASFSALFITGPLRGNP